MLILAAALIVVLLGATGLAVDVGVARVQRRDLQNAADAAALAGADDLPGQPAAVAISDATCGAAQNGAVDQQGNVNCQNQSYGGDAGVTVSVNSPPVHSKSHNGDPNSVEVTITKKVPTAFMGVLGIRTVTVTAHAVATASGSLPCVLCVQDPNAAQSLFMRGDASVTVSGGDIVVNSQDANGAWAQSNASVTVSGGFTGVVGGWHAQDNATFSPTPTANVAPAPDPLASVPVPTISGPFQGSVSLLGNSSLTIGPGVYTDITVGGNAQLKLNPGIYVVTGTFWMRSDSITSNDPNAGGVVLYFACPSSTAPFYQPCTPDSDSDLTPDNANPCLTGSDGDADDGGEFCISANATDTLSAPTSGPYQGIAIFYDRNNRAPLELYGSSNDDFTGTIYAKSSQLLCRSNGGLQQLNSLVVVDTAEMSSNCAVSLTFNKSQNANVSGAGASALTE